MKVNEEEEEGEEVLTIMAKEVPVILIVAIMGAIMIREANLMVLESAVVGVEILILVAEEAVVKVTETTKIIRAIIMWYQCLEHLVIAPDQDAVYPNVSLKKVHGLVFNLSKNGQ